MWKFVSGLWPPETSPKFLGQAAWAAVQTLAISIMGTLLSVFIALGLSCFASDNLMYRGVLYERERSSTAGGWVRYAGYWTARTTMAILRSIPEIVLAILFIFAVGLGPFAGVLALGVHNGGVLGKLYAEVIENVDPQPIEALQTTGAGRTSVFLYGVLPQAFPQLLAYTLYRWEVNIRTATILGIVGAGGLGLKLGCGRPGAEAAHRDQPVPAKPIAGSHRRYLHHRHGGGLPVFLPPPALDLAALPMRLTGVKPIPQSVLTRPKPPARSRDRFRRPCRRGERLPAPP
jgi:phosphonate ABC transporter permease subunit PhnE